VPKRVLLQEREREARKKKGRVFVRAKKPCGDVVHVVNGGKTKRGKTLSGGRSPAVKKGTCSRRALRDTTLSSATRTQGGGTRPRGKRKKEGPGRREKCNPSNQTVVPGHNCEIPTVTKDVERSPQTGNWGQSVPFEAHSLKNENRTKTAVPWVSCLTVQGLTVPSARNKKRKGENWQKSGLSKVARPVRRKKRGRKKPAKGWGRGGKNTPATPFPEWEKDTLTLDGKSPGTSKGKDKPTGKRGTSFEPKDGGAKGGKRGKNHL